MFFIFQKTHFLAKETRQMYFFEKGVFGMMEATKKEREVNMNLEMDPQEELSALNIQTIPHYLQKRGVPLWFKRGQTIMEKDEPTRYVYLLLLGDAVLFNEFEDGSYYSFAHLRTGRYLGDLEVLSGKEINVASVVAWQDSFALRFTIEDFKKCLDEDIVFLRSVAQVMAIGMYGSSYERGRNHYRHGTDKLIRFLIKYYEFYSVENDCPEVTVRRTRPEIASEIGVNIKTVDRSVKALRESGVIQMNHGKIRLDADAYAKLCKESVER